MEEFAAPASDGLDADLNADLDVDLAVRLRALVAEMAAQITVSGPALARAQPPIMVPEPVALAITGAAGEALRNVARHAGTGRATLQAVNIGGTATVEIADRGRGFEPRAVPAGRHGIARSITQRMAAAGGSATVTSRPGDGTQVVLRWHRG
jgi:signal transduction histidine kinase